MRESDGQTFGEWAARWIQLATFPGARLEDEDQRIRDVLELWSEPIPECWERDGLPERLKNPEKRNCRGEDGQGQHRGEYLLERCVLEPSPADWTTLCLGARLIDGVNGFPLAIGKTVEADMLLLVQDDDGYGLQLVEVKVKSDHAWHGAVESLRQLRLFRAHPMGSSLFQERGVVPDLPGAMRVTAVVLAPNWFYWSPNKKRESVEPARRLLHEVCEAHGVSAQLAEWNSDLRTMVAV